ncbi:MAG: thiamine ABC transporter substrate-binding protein [Acidimicrobiia bacterium]|nr:MAG: thiamine ABC transporter substrate-binding protein [Acidimicrobiia bacterium]
MRRQIAFWALLLVVAACGDGTGKVTLLAHDFFAVSDEVLAEFTEQTGIEVEVVLAGDAGLMVNQAILASGNPVADVIFGVDNTLLSRALDGDLFEEYRSPAMEDVPAPFDAGVMVTPIDFGDVCVNYDRAAFTTLPPPTTLTDLADPAYAGMLVVEDPGASSPGLAFLLATIAEFGEEGPYSWRDFWSDLRANEVLVATDWGVAYYGHFSGAGDGDRPLVVSYASSPGAELIFSDPPPPEPSTATMTGGCFRQVEYAGILRGTENRPEAERLIDFMLSIRFQEDVPGNMLVYPVRSDAAVPSWMGDPLPAPERTLTPAEIEAGRDRWLAEWTEIVLR